MAPPQSKTAEELPSTGQGDVRRSRSGPGYKAQERIGGIAQLQLNNYPYVTIHFHPQTNPPGLFLSRLCTKTNVALNCL